MRTSERCCVMRSSLGRVLGILCALAPCAAPASAEVTRVQITSRGEVADGQEFGRVGRYEKLTGTIEFAIDPRDRHNSRIVDLDRATTGPDGRVHFSASLFVLRPVDSQRGNGVLLFEIANRGRMSLLGRFNRASASQNPTASADFGDGFLMKEGYTLVWIGWQFDVASNLLRVEAPAVDVPGRIRFSFITNEKQTTAAPADLPPYQPLDFNEVGAALTVRNTFWETPKQVHRSRWRFVVEKGRLGVQLDDGFEPGLVYEVDYAATGARVAGVGLAAIRDAASAFRYRTDLPIRGRLAYVFGISQSGRFLRQFLHDGFNADEKDRRAFDLVWPHIAGAGQGSFNERFAMPGYSSFPATRFPYTDLEQSSPDGRKDGILAKYGSRQMPKVIYTNSSVEYWGQGRAAALTHTRLDGTRDADVPDNVRIYLLAGTQHGEAQFPPKAGATLSLPNPTPQGDVMRALLRAAHEWVAKGTKPPDSRHPTLRDRTLVSATGLRFPILSGSPSTFLDLPNPRTGIEGPAYTEGGRVTALPFLVPQVDADGNEIAGIRVPEVVVPLATTTGWNFRRGGPGIYPLMGSYIPFARTKAEREPGRDPRPSIEERYRDRDDYLRRIRAAADALVKDRFLLRDDVEDVVARADRHWSYATAARATN